MLLQRVRTYLLLSALIIASNSAHIQAQTSSAEAKPEAQQSTAERDGQHDFDPMLGSWKYHLKRRQKPLTGSNTWVDLEGTGVNYKVWDGRANLDTIEVEGSTGHIEGLTLRLYNPQSHQWRLYWANSKIGIMDPPQIGEFQNGHGHFFAQDKINNRAILIQFDWSGMTTTSPHFEQSFSDDGGKTWEVNWITDQTKTNDESEKGESAQSPMQMNSDQSKTEPQKTDGQHDFDFEFGSWNVHLKRLLHPLTGSNEWVDYDGTSVVRKVWNGRANLGELEIGNPTSRIEGLSLRLYDPLARQWRLYWANSKEGILNVPTIGEFKNGRGEFVDQEDFQGRAILVRFVFSDITPTSFRGEQSFSADGGKTWEPNWVSEFERVPAHTSLNNPSPAQTAASAGPHDFDFLIGQWQAHHRVLKERLANNHEWMEYDGTLTTRELMGGWANVGDNVFSKPGGDIRGVSLRSYDSKTGQWAVWWLDGRNPSAGLDPPITGRFENGVGTFYSDGMLRGKPIRVRVTWSRITNESAHWEQAFSPDGGTTWETNWITDFHRVS